MKSSSHEAFVSRTWKTSFELKLNAAPVLLLHTVQSLRKMKIEQQCTVVLKYVYGIGHKGQSVLVFVETGDSSAFEVCGKHKKTREVEEEKLHRQSIVVLLTRSWIR